MGLGRDMGWLREGREGKFWGKRVRDSLRVVLD